VKKDEQPFKFRMMTKDGRAIEGGAESKDLCVAHVRQCLSDPQMNVASGTYLGKNGTATPKAISV
jgi:hypothetical protein